MPKRILIVDDDVSMSAVVEVRVKNAGYEVIKAGNGKSALEKLRRSKPDLVMVDFRMPGMTGEELCKIIKRDEDLKSILVILMTASMEKTTPESIRSMGADGTVEKPFETADLLAEIKRVLGA